MLLGCALAVKTTWAIASVPLSSQDWTCTSSGTKPILRREACASRRCRRPATPRQQGHKDDPSPTTVASNHFYSFGRSIGVTAVLSENHMVGKQIRDSSIPGERDHVTVQV